MERKRFTGAVFLFGLMVVALLVLTCRPQPEQQQTAIASFTATISFQGLVSFVPIEENGKLETMWVLMPNGEEGKGPCFAVAETDKRPEHRAFLRYFAKNLAGRSLGSDGDQQKVLTPLDEMDMRIESSLERRTREDHCGAGLEQGDLRRYRTRKPETQFPEINTCETLDFSWVPDLGHFASSVANVCANCLEDPATPDFPLARIISRLKITQGTLQVDSLEEVDGVGFASYKFKNGSSSDVQALANGVSLRLEGLTEPITFTLSSLAGLSSVREKRITLSPSTPGENIEVEVMNHVPLALVDPNFEHDHRDGFPDVVDDFRLYYRVAAAIDPETGDGCLQKEPLPVPQRIKSEANRPICPKAQMLPPEK